MDDGRRRIGAWGEDVAARLLAARGLTVRDRGWRFGRLGEIDIVAEDGDVVVFCEVKTRSGAGFGLPEEAVTPLKQARIRRLAEAYLCQYRLVGSEVRFDVVAVEERGERAPAVRHVPDAF